MRRKSKIGLVLFQVAAVVFLLNATAAYGACCFLQDNSDPVVVSLPCHHTEDVGSSEPSSDCCPMCLTMIPPDAPLAAPAAQSKSTVVFAHTPALSLTSEPLFRPPIANLS